MLASGFFALLVTEMYGFLAGVLFTLLLFAGWQVDAGKWSLHIAPFWWNAATFGALALSVGDAVFFRRLPAVTLVNFLIFLQATKILNPKRQRDYVTIYIISFVQLLASTVMTYSVLFAVSCILFAISATWALVTLYLKTEIETYVLSTALSPGRNGETPEERLQREHEAFNLPVVNTLLNTRFFTGTFGITLLTFGLALGIFVIMPRVREGFFFRYGADWSQQVSGFSEEVDLNTFGTIRMNYRPVMRVTLPEEIDPNTLPKPLYWKGLSFDYYGGDRWRADPKQWKRIRVQPRDTKLYWFTWQPDTMGLLRQEIELGTANYEVVFGADTMKAVEGKFLSLQYDPVTGNANVVFDPYTLTYTVYSDFSQPSEAMLREESQEYPEDIARYYLQVPEMAERVRVLARQIGDHEATVYDKALAVQTYLIQNYAYSLDVPRSGTVPLLEDFLFLNKAGHCEYYATSMAILLRILGIPARVVNGFARGRWNEYGHFFTVRQSDAHSWVEVYFPSYGWITFDPTPGAAFGETYQEFVEQENLIASLYRYSEYLRVRWNRYVVDYDREDQAQAIVSTFIAARQARRNLRSWLSQQRQRLERIKARFSGQNILRMTAIIGGTACAGYMLLWLLRRWRIRIPWPSWRIRKRARQKQIVRFYHRMRRILARKGVSLASSATPGEFARYVAQEYAVYAQDVHELTDLYYAVRYGHLELRQEHLWQITNTLQHIKSTVRVKT